MGQKLMKLVNINTAPKISSTSPNVPDTVCVKYKTEKTAAKSNLITRSMVPIFFFIIISLKFKFLINKKASSNLGY